MRCISLPQRGHFTTRPDSLIPPSPTRGGSVRTVSSGPTLTPQCARLPCLELNAPTEPYGLARGWTSWPGPQRARGGVAGCAARGLDVEGLADEVVNDDRFCDPLHGAADHYDLRAAGSRSLPPHELGAVDAAEHEVDRMSAGFSTAHSAKAISAVSAEGEAIARVDDDPRGELSRCRGHLRRCAPAPAPSPPVGKVPSVERSSG
jgi:hypothetical protein